MPWLPVGPLAPPGSEAVEPCVPLGKAPASPPAGLEEPGRLAVPREPESEGMEGEPELEEEPLDDDGRLGMEGLDDEDEVLGMPGIEELDDEELEGDGSEGLEEELELELEDDEGVLGMLLEELEEELVVSQADSTRASAPAVIRLARECVFILDLLLPLKPTTAREPRVRMGQFSSRLSSA